ncbi:hypothetical protein ACMBCM_10415, partial [Spiroplasma sp. K1]
MCRSLWAINNEINAIIKYYILHIHENNSIPYFLIYIYIYIYIFVCVYKFWKILYHNNSSNVD